jgi:hypothetical protein
MVDYRPMGLFQSGRDIAASHLKNVQHIIKFGLNDDVDASGGGPEDVWNAGGLYTGFPTGAAETISVVSDSASDTAAGTGMRTMRIIGLDSSYNLQTEDVTLNGVTPVATTATWMRVRSVYGLTAGSSAGNVGTVTVRHTTTTANVFAVISPGFGQAHICAFTVPAAYTALLVQLVTCSSKSPAVNNDVCMGIMTRDFGSGIWRTQALVSAKTSAGTSVLTIAGGLPLAAKTDVVLRVLSASADNLRASGMMELFLHPA